MKKYLLLLLFALCALAGFAKTYSVGDIPNVHRADSSQYVSNPDGILSAATVEQLNALLRDIRRTTSAEAVAVVVDNIEGGDIDTFATELFGAWGLGKKDKDNGLLILVSTGLRRAAIRTGYGLEGVMPDIVCGRILRNVMIPRFRQGDYDGGVIAATQAIDRILTDPDNRDEILSSEADVDLRHNDDLDLREFFGIYFTLSGLATLALLLIIAAVLYRNRGRSNHEKYLALNNIKPTALIVTFVGLGLPALASVPLLLLMGHFRNQRRTCRRCGSKMNKVDEVHDNDYLNAAQDTEEQLGTVDYDVWLCPSCGETDIEPYVKANTGFQRCPVCGGLTSRYTRDRILRKPTTLREGEGVKEYTCLNCGHITDLKYVIPVVVAPIILGGGGRSGGGGFGGGGFGGGGFGGGMTGGGGASGGW